MDRPPPSSDIHRWVATWRRAGEALAGVKRDELAGLDTLRALEHLADAFDLALRQAPTSATSGLVEQQRIFARLRG